MFLAGGSRVELNAMPSDQFICWIEAGLQEHGVTKVVPSNETIEARSRYIVGMRHLKRDVAKLERAARNHAAGVELPADLAERIRDGFQRDPTLPWEDALAAAMTTHPPGMTEDRVISLRYRSQGSREADYYQAT
jgi:hypothetical protein